jgi:rhamnosyltransferase
MNYKIIAHITAFNDLNSVLHLLQLLQKQSFLPDKILIFDNSNIPLYHNKFLSKRIIIHHSNDNIGVSGSLNFAIQFAIDNNYDFLWTFDQDSQPSLNTLETLLTEFEFLAYRNIAVGILSPKIIDSQSQIELINGYFITYRFKWKLPHKSFYLRNQIYCCDSVITSGSLINLKSAKQVSLPNSELFIDGVDWDYCLKLRQKSFQIFVSERTSMQHNFGTYLKTIGNKFPIYIYSPLRYYYINRNHTYIETRISSNFFYVFLSYLHRFKCLINKIIKIICFEPDQKLLKIWASILGFIHGLIGRLGKTWLP